MNNFNLQKFILIALPFFLFGCIQEQKKEWKPNTDWGHWVLGQKADLDFLKKNNMTITFGSGAPNFESVSRAKFDSLIQDAKIFNQSYHDQGYTVLRYLSTSLNGNSESNKDIPKKEQIDLLKFYTERWDDFKDYIGPKPPEDPTTWMMVHRDGTFPFYRYAPYGKEPDEGFEAWGVPVNPWYVQMMEGKVRAQAETGIDGSYIDWTHIASRTSYDTYTHAGFIKYLQENLPPEIGQKKYGTGDYSKVQMPEKRGDKFWMEWITYRGYQVAEFHKHMRTVARKYNPDFMVSGNVFGGFGYGPIAYDGAGNMEMLAAEGYDDFIYSEMQEYLDAAPRKNEQGKKTTNSPALKFLAAVSHGKPVIVYATEITPPIFPDPTEKCLSAMAQINIAEAVANHCIFREKRQTPQGATDLYAFLAPQRPKLIGSHMYSNVAILASLNQYLADEQSFAFSLSRVMADAGVSHVFLVEKDLGQKDLSTFDVIVLPYLPLLSTAEQEALDTFAQAGGTLVVLGKTGWKDEFNSPNARIPLLETGALNEYPGQKLQKTTGKGQIVYLPFEIPAHKYLTQQQAKSDATTFGPSMADIFADIPEGYTRDNMHPQLRENLESVVGEIKALQPSGLTLLENGSPFVEMTTMRKGNEHMLVHLVNYNVTIDGTVTPAENLRAVIALPEGVDVKSVKYNGQLGQMQDIPFDLIENGSRKVVKVTFPSVDIYGLAVVEFK